MNCRPGDLAVSVGGERIEHIGVIVKVLRPYVGAQMWRGRSDWVIEYRGEVYAGEDKYLRPIRPGDISDEEVRDLYLPKVPEHA